MNTNLKRLQKRIAEQSDYSRRKAEELIIEGKVSVNGETIQELGYKVTDKDKIEIEGVALNTNEKKYFILNKPEKCVSTVSDDKGRKTVIDFIKTKAKVYPIGRLDYDTTGILLLTNDGELAQNLTHPSKGVEKTYEVRIKGRVRDEDLQVIANGVKLEDGMTAPATIVDLGFDDHNGVHEVEISMKVVIDKFAVCLNTLGTAFII